MWMLLVKLRIRRIGLLRLSRMMIKLRKKRFRYRLCSSRCGNFSSLRCLWAVRLCVVVVVLCTVVLLVGFMGELLEELLCLCYWFY